jgi:hypothetical protein
VWTDCCVKLKKKGLSLIDLEATTISLVVKWEIKVFDGGKSNLHLLIQFMSRCMYPNKKTNGVMGLPRCYLNIIT